MSHSRRIGDQLQTQLDAHGLIAPSYHEHSLASVLPAAAAALGYEHVLESVAATTGGAARARSAAASLGLPAVERVCVVLIDGLGMANLLANPGATPFLSSLLAEGSTGKTGFPSTTASSMGTFGTGACTGQTAMVGYSAAVPGTDDIGNFVSWRDLPPPHEVQRHPVIFELLARAGLAVTSVGLSRFDGSGMTRAALRGAAYVGAESLHDHVDLAATALNYPGLVYLYWGEVDKIGHHAGTRAATWRAALAKTDYELGRLFVSLPPKTAMIVTADHGMIDVDPAKLIDISTIYALSKGVRAVGGEPRAAHVYLNSPGSAHKTRNTWRTELGERALVLTKEEAIAGGLFGAVTKSAAKWMGDLVVAMTGTDLIADSNSAPAQSLRLLGVHGSLTAAEVEIPLLVAVT